MSWFDYLWSDRTTSPPPKGEKFPQRFEAGVPTGEPKVSGVIRPKGNRDASGREVGDFYPMAISRQSRLGPKFSLLDWCRARRVAPDEGTKELLALVHLGYLEQAGIEPVGGPVFRRTPRFAGLLKEN